MVDAQELETLISRVYNGKPLTEDEIRAMAQHLWEGATEELNRAAHIMQLCRLAREFARPYTTAACSSSSLQMFFFGRVNKNRLKVLGHRLRGAESQMKKLEKLVAKKRLATRNHKNGKRS